MLLLLLSLSFHGHYHNQNHYHYKHEYTHIILRCWTNVPVEIHQRPLCSVSSIWIIDWFPVICLLFWLSMSANLSFQCHAISLPFIFPSTLSTFFSWPFRPQLIENTFIYPANTEHLFSHHIITPYITRELTYVIREILIPLKTQWFSSMTFRICHLHNVGHFNHV